MQIDLFTLIAQVINFALLVWLLKRFLYHPVLEAMARREAAIKNRLQQAAEQAADAEHRADEYRDKCAGFDADAQRRRELQAVELDAERRAAFDAARAELENVRSDWRQALADEQHRRERELRRQLGERALQLAQQVLCDLADASLEQQAVAVLLNQLGALDAAERRLLLAGTDGIRIASAMPLSPELQQQFGERLAALLGAQPELNFVHDPELIAGVELYGAQHRIGWSAADLLNGLREQLLAVNEVAVDDAHSINVGA